QMPVQAVAARAGFVNELEAAVSFAQPVNQAIDSFNSIRDRPQRPQLAGSSGLGHRDRNRNFVNVKAHEGLNVRHKLAPSFPIKDNRQGEWEACRRGPAELRDPVIPSLMSTPPPARLSPKKRSIALASFMLSIKSSTDCHLSGDDSGASFSQS